MSVGMSLIPNPADGIVHALSMRTGKELGVCKSYFDIVNVSTSLICGFFFENPLLGIGIGRCISLFNKLFRHKLRTAAGLEEPVTAA